MKKLDAKPYDFECTLAEAPLGMFVKDNFIGIKTGRADANDDQRAMVINSDGTPFTAGTSTMAERDALVVVPVAMKWTIT